MGELVPIDKNGFMYFPAEATVEEIRSAMEPADGREIEKYIAMLFSGLKSGDRGEMDSQMTADIYSMALVDLPGWAIEKATMNFIMGKVENASRTFVPSTAELVNEVTKQMWLRVRMEQPVVGPDIKLPENHLKNKWLEKFNDLNKFQSMKDE